MIIIIIVSIIIIVIIIIITITIIIVIVIIIITIMIRAIMARYVWYCVGFSPRDGGWVRFGFFRYCSSEEMAWESICWLWDLMVLAGDYITVDVRRTIAF